MRTVILAAVAAMLSLPAGAQAPPAIPRYYCPTPPALDTEIQYLLVLYQSGQWSWALLRRMQIADSALTGYQRGCQERYQRQVLEWQMEMQRYQMTR